MRKKGLRIKQMGEDGACLFRAVADQVYGDQEMHDIVRKQCMDYLVSIPQSFFAVSFFNWGFFWCRWCVFLNTFRFHERMLSLRSTNMHEFSGRQS